MTDPLPFEFDAPRAAPREADGLAALIGLLEADQSPAEVLESLLDVLRPLVSLEAVGLAMVEAGRARAEHGAGPVYSPGELEAGAALVVASGGPRPEAVPGLASHRAFVPVCDPAGRVRAVLGAWQEGGSGWKPDETRLLEAAARVVGIALERAAVAARLEARAAEVEAIAHAVSHDLRGPLISLDGMARLLADELGPAASPEVGFALSRITANVSKLSRLADDVLELSKAGRLEHGLEPVPVGEAVAAALGALNETLAVGRVRVIAPEVWPTVPGQLAGLARVYTHLIGNAARFRRPDEPDPWVRLEWTSEPWGFAFTVADNGTGVPEAMLERLFEPFFRLDLSAEGTGVGLAVVRRVVVALGGEVTAGLLPGGGLLVRFSLPRERSPG